MNVFRVVKLRGEQKCEIVNDLDFIIKDPVQILHTGEHADGLHCIPCQMLPQWLIDEIIPCPQSRQVFTAPIFKDTLNGGLMKHVLFIEKDRLLVKVLVEVFYHLVIDILDAGVTVRKETPNVDKVSNRFHEQIEPPASLKALRTRRKNL